MPAPLASDTQSPARDPETLADVAAALRAAHAEGAALAAGLPLADYHARPGEGWSPHDHLRHLVRSTRAVSRGLALPRIAVRLMFGRARAPSLPYAALRDRYRAALAAGGKATGAYVPPAETEADPERSRARAVSRWTAAGEELVAAMGRWDEGALDRLRLPHPLIGKLTVREMLFFTLYHDRHHLDAMRRLAAASRGG